MADPNTTNATPAAIETRGLEKRYGEEPALRPLDLRIETGACFALLGPNGAGKTTTVHLLTTLLQASGGSATVAGFDVARQPRAVRGALGIVFQDSCLDPKLSAREHLDLSAQMYRVRPRALRATRVAASLADFGLEALADRPTDALSGGERRRLEIARALLHEPPLLFLDEPTVGLDVAARATLWDQLRALQRERGTSLFLTTHSMEEADALATRVGVLDRGRLVAEGEPATLKAGLGGDRVWIRVERDEEDARRSLEAAPGVQGVTRDPLGLCIQVDAAPRRLAALIAAAERYGIAWVEFQRPSLEEVYLHYTGRRFRVEAEASPGDAP